MRPNFKTLVIGAQTILHAAVEAQGDYNRGAPLLVQQGLLQMAADCRTLARQTEEVRHELEKGGWV